MTAARFSPSAKWIVVLLCLASWLVASNHCALGALNHASRTKVCCAKNGADASSKDQQVQCCKVLKPVVQTLAKAPAGPEAVAAEPDFAEIVSAFLKVCKAEEVAPMGDPPPVGWFTAVDLQRCHRAVAPPVFS